MVGNFRYGEHHGCLPKVRIRSWNFWTVRTLANTGICRANGDIGIVSPKMVTPFYVSRVKIQSQNRLRMIPGKDARIRIVRNCFVILLFLAFLYRWGNLVVVSSRDKHEISFCIDGGTASPECRSGIQSLLATVIREHFCSPYDLAGFDVDLHKTSLKRTAQLDRKSFLCRWHAYVVVTASIENGSKSGSMDVYPVLY